MVDDGIAEIAKLGKWIAASSMPLAFGNVESVLPVLLRLISRSSTQSKSK
jgi:hypothetical protein